MKKNIKYTAFLDVLGFSDYIKEKITNDDEAKKFYKNINNRVITYFQYLKTDDTFKEIDMLKNINTNYTWISDTFVISMMCDSQENDIKIKALMIQILSMGIADVYHFFALEYGLMIRGSISSKYTFINDKLILGEGISEASILEKNIAIYPRVIFAKDIITDDIMDIISLLHDDDLLNIVSKDCDGYYFVNYIGLLQEMPPMIKTTNSKKNLDIEDKKKEVLKKYYTIANKNINHPSNKVQQKYMWLKNYIDKLLPSDGKTYNMFAYNILSIESQQKIKHTKS